jgi:hypothetical protein
MQNMVYKTLLGAFLIGAPVLAGAQTAAMPEMQHVATAAQLQLTEQALNAALSKNQKISLKLTNPNAHAVKDAAVCVALPAGTLYKSATVRLKGKELPSQMDDLNGDGVKDELAFVVDLKKGGSATVEVELSTAEAAADRYPARVHAQMFFADKDKKHRVKQHIPTDTVSEVVDNMYSKMHHHGPAFESDQVAYRVYFDKKQSTDLYGKRVRQLELAEGLWYNDTTVLDLSYDLRQDKQYGDDMILVGQTISIGTLRGWDESLENPMVMIDPFEWRQAHIVAKGPVRTVVDMNVKGWQYKGRLLNLKSRYTLYAGNRECEVIQQFEGDTKDLEFVTGVMIVGTLPPLKDGDPEGEHYSMSDGTGLCASWGRNWPDGNRKLYPTQATSALAVTVPQEYVNRTIEQPTQILYGVHAGSDNALRYRMAFAAPDKETFVSEPWSWQSWCQWCAEWKATLPVEVRVR